MKLDKDALAKHPLPPVVDGDKETKGRLLVIAGSAQVPGAALLTATAAMRAGGGKLRIATSASIATAIGVAMPEAMVVPLPEAADGSLTFAAADEIVRQAETADAIVAGPGLKESESCKRIADSLLESNAKLAFDAAMLRCLEPLPNHKHSSELILLPHAGELASLL
ncbi:MAG TPA: NAD(P)H-hydrate dehydratase, partial [Sphingomicrobium sp.]|nr:NAD(P)H-hydrate dehydratase [Sphingomicrobium sp.]